MTMFGRKGKNKITELARDQARTGKEKIKVRLFDRYGNQPVKFTIWVPSKDNFLEDAAKKIKILFGW